MHSTALHRYPCTTVPCRHSFSYSDTFLNYSWCGVQSACWTYGKATIRTGRTTPRDRQIDRTRTRQIVLAHMTDRTRTHDRLYSHTWQIVLAHMTDRARTHDRSCSHTWQIVLPHMTDCTRTHDMHLQQFILSWNIVFSCNKFTVTWCPHTKRISHHEALKQCRV